MPPTDLPRIPHQRKLNDAHRANASGLYSYANVQNSAGNGSRITTSSHHGLSRGTQTVMTCSVEGNRGHHCCCVSERVHPSGTSQSHGSTNSKRIADSAIKCQGGSQNGRGVTGALKALLLMSHSLSGNCGASTIAIDNKIEQAMDLVKSHLMFAVREEVEVLKEQIKDLVEKNSQLEMENNVLRANATKETLSQLSTNQPPAGATTTTQTSQGSTSASTSQPTNSTTQPPTQQPQKS